MHRLVFAALFCGLLAGQQEPPKPPAKAPQPTAPDQKPPDQDTFKFTIGTEYVSTPVWVYDHDGQYVSGLRPDQFRLFDNDKEQNIQVDVSFTPISLVICVQSNSHVAGLLPQVRKIGNLVKPLLIGEQGEAALIAYDSRIRVLQDFTNDADKINIAVAKISPGSDANHMIDSVVEATRMLTTRPRNRQRVILLIGETRDLYSEARIRETMMNLQLANVVFHAVDMSRFVTTLLAPVPVPRPDTRPAPLAGAPALPSFVPATPTTVANATGNQGGRAEFVPLMVELYRDAKAIFRDNPVEAFTKATGGSEFGFHSQRTLEDAFMRLGELLHSEYMVSYSPNNRDEFGFHEIKVDVPRRSDVRKVITRPGYWLGPK
jgi:VWFA-related protein